jgi:WhiB family transcriptional regulator, redox-sensing transcriptional regulator
MSNLPCREEPDLFFAESPRLLEQAQGLCAGCPVQEMCLAGALERREPHGVWGGKIFVAGLVVQHKRGRGRPRKTDVA